MADDRTRLRDGDSFREPGLRRRIVDEACDEQGSKDSGCADYTIKRLHGGFLPKTNAGPGGAAAAGTLFTRWIATRCCRAACSRRLLSSADPESTDVS
jgi:hypothetical protein